MTESKHHQPPNIVNDEMTMVTPPPPPPPLPLVTNRNFVVRDENLTSASGGQNSQLDDGNRAGIISPADATASRQQEIVTYVERDGSEGGDSLSCVKLDIEGQESTLEPGGSTHVPGEFISLHHDQTRVSTVSGGPLSLGSRLNSTSSPGSRYNKRRDAMPRRTSSQGHQFFSEESDSDQDYDTVNTPHSTAAHHDLPNNLTKFVSRKGSISSLAAPLGTRMESALKRLFCCYLPHSENALSKKRSSQSQRRKSVRLRNSIDEVTRGEKRAVDDIELANQSTANDNNSHITRSTSEHGNAEDVPRIHNASDSITSIHNLITQVQRQSNLGKYNHRSSSSLTLSAQHTNRLPNNYHYQPSSSSSSSSSQFQQQQQLPPPPPPQGSNLLVKQIPRSNMRRSTRRASDISGSHFEDKYLLDPQPGQLHGRKTLVLDLDETLVHSSFRPVFGADFVIEVEIDRMMHKVYVCKRPGVDQFLEAMSKHFEIVVFTASLSKYANPVMDRLDPRGFITSRLFREACTFRGGNYIKDLRRLGRDLSQTAIVDNSPTCFSMQPENGLGCTSWFDDPSCRELLQMIPLLEHMAMEPDIYETVDMYKRSIFTG